MSNAPPSPTPVNEHDTTRERVGAIAAWLVNGKLRPECVGEAMKEWQVSRRTAQVYVARAAARIVKATTFEDPHFALKLSQVQRDKLHQELQELLRKGEFLPLPHWKLKLQTIQADLKLLDSRDRTAAKLLQAAERTKTEARGQRSEAGRDCKQTARGSVARPSTAGGRKDQAAAWATAARADAGGRCAGPCVHAQGQEGPQDASPWPGGDRARAGSHFVRIRYCSDSKSVLRGGNARPACR